MLEPLRPSETVQRVLISSTARFVGDYEDQNISVDHAWSYFRDRSASLRMEEGPYSRNAFVISFRTQQVMKEVGLIIPDYHPFGDSFSAFASLIYGKRFDNHGSLVNMGSFRVPNLIALDLPNNHYIPQNRHIPRADMPFPLHLSETRRFINLYYIDKSDQQSIYSFITACRFYLRALQNTESDIEIAYLNLITAGEIISNSFINDHDVLIDDELKSVLQKIESEVKGGKKLSNVIRNRVRSIKRKFVHTICSLVDEEFFSRREADQLYSTFNKSTFEKCINAAYDIRSRYVHTGVSFGPWMHPSRSDQNSEIQLGEPVVEDLELGKSLALAPTYVGLERVIRYVLLRYADRMGFIDTAISPTEPTID